MEQYRYKLTNQDRQTYNDTLWEVGEWKEVSGVGQLCDEGWLHCYCDPLLAVLHNPIYGDVRNPRLWRVEVSGKCLRDGDMKEGWSRMRFVEELPVPEVTVTQKVAYGMLCALEVYQELGFVEWANRWLSGEDRTAKAAGTAAKAAAWAAEAATKAAAGAAGAARAAAKAAAWAAWAAKDSINLPLIANKALSIKQEDNNNGNL